MALRFPFPQDPELPSGRSSWRREELLVCSPFPGVQLRLGSAAHGEAAAPSINTPAAPAPGKGNLGDNAG